MQDMTLTDLRKAIDKRIDLMDYGAIINIVRETLFSEAGKPDTYTVISQGEMVAGGYHSIEAASTEAAYYEDSSVVKIVGSLANPS